MSPLGIPAENPASSVPLQSPFSQKLPVPSSPGDLCQGGNGTTLSPGFLKLNSSEEQTIPPPEGAFWTDRENTDREGRRTEAAE